MEFSIFATELQKQIQYYLETCLPSLATEPARLHEAMRYSVLNGGKRIRPLLVYAIGQSFNATLEDLNLSAAAVEIIHCYSLIHDDLPAMDNDDLRRGKPTCHKAFDEATAILAGDALQALAFEVLANSPSQFSDSKRLELIKLLGIACGSQGMAGGQALDLAATGKSLNLEYVEIMHSKKTGALITASAMMGAITGNANAQQLAAIKAYGDLIGLAFQIQDDILDIEGDTALLGKMVGADLAADKLTYPAIVGLETAKRKVEELYQNALAQLVSIDLNTPLLNDLSLYLIQRKT